MEVQIDNFKMAQTGINTWLSLKLFPDYEYVYQYHSFADMMLYCGDLETRLVFADTTDSTNITNAVKHCQIANTLPIPIIVSAHPKLWAH